jgi:hypothetical protein
MAQKAITGLLKMPNGIWKIDKKYRGERIQEFFRQKAARRRCDRGRPESFARAQERKHHQSLLSGRAGSIDCSGK